MTIEVFLDDTPGETRGVIVRNGRAEYLIIHRHHDPPSHRLGARSIGRVRAVAPGLRGGFVELPDGDDGFLPFDKGPALKVGEAVEVQTTAESRAGKGPALKRVKQAAEDSVVRLLAPAPGVAKLLSELAAEVAPRGGADAVRASIEAEEEALADRLRLPEFGLDLAVERTRALIAVDIDHAPNAGRDPRRDRGGVNAEGLRQAARLIRLKAWGGLVAVDLAGTQVPPEIMDQAKAAFGSGAVFGPLSRFGLLQLSLPWGRRPIEEATAGARARAVAGLRRLRLALLSDTQTARLVLKLPPEEAAIAATLGASTITGLGPRAVVEAEPALAPGRWQVEESRS